MKAWRLETNEEEVMMRKVSAFILLYACVVMLLLASGVYAQQPATKPAFTFQEV